MKSISYPHRMVSIFFSVLFLIVLFTGFNSCTDPVLSCDNSDVTSVVHQNGPQTVELVNNRVTITTGAASNPIFNGSNKLDCWALSQYKILISSGNCREMTAQKISDNTVTKTYSISTSYKYGLREEGTTICVYRINL